MKGLFVLVAAALAVLALSATPALSHGSNDDRCQDPVASSMGGGGSDCDDDCPELARGGGNDDDCGGTTGGSIDSSFLSLRTMMVRCAQGQAHETYR